jgi:hypothetical protein
MVSGRTIDLITCAVGIKKPNPFHQWKVHSFVYSTNIKKHLSYSKHCVRRCRVEFK